MLDRDTAEFCKDCERKGIVPTFEKFVAEVRYK